MYQYQYYILTLATAHSQQRMVFIYFLGTAQSLFNFSLFIIVFETCIEISLFSKKVKRIYVRF